MRNYRVSEWLAWFREVGLDGSHLRTFPTCLDFDDWTARMNTPEPERAQLRRLMDAAPAEVRAAFDVAANHDWKIPLALFRATRPRLAAGA